MLKHLLNFYLGLKLWMLKHGQYYFVLLASLYVNINQRRMNVKKKAITFSWELYGH